MLCYILTTVLVLSAAPALANDTTAEFNTGGLILSRSGAGEAN